MTKSLSIFPLLALPFATVAGEIDFARDIRPILSETCFTCHGPDSEKRKGELRLDVKESAFGKAESGASAVVPGDVAKSELVKRIFTDDKDDVMPPPKELKLSPEEEPARLLRRVRLFLCQPRSIPGSCLLCRMVR